MKLTLIQQAEVYTPDYVGMQPILVVGDKIVKIGHLDKAGLQTLGLACEMIEASHCVAVPGFIDPHEHLIGAGGEQGFTSRMPEILLSQIVSAGITTVVGLLGTDTTTRHLACLHAKVRQLDDEGITAYMYTGGFELPPSTLTGSITDDLVMIDKIIGTGEVAISDVRWVDPLLNSLAHVVTEGMLGGMMSDKAGVTHFHTGPGKKRLALLHELLDNYEMPPHCIYATHITRSEALMDEAIALAKRGAYVDMDTIDENLGDCLRYYLSHGGPPEQLTVSSDAHTPSGSPRKLYEQFVSCVREHQFSLAVVLPFFTRNTAQVLKLSGKGSLAAGNDADILLLDKDTLEIVHLFAKGKQFIKAGQLVIQSKQEEQVAAGKE
jgi:beta-aspartyl-dipeptidase (metallo-type)